MAKLSDAHLHKYKKDGRTYEVLVGKDVVTYQPEKCKICGWRRNRVVKNVRSRWRMVFGEKGSKGIDKP